MGSPGLLRAREAFASNAWDEAHALYAAEGDRTALELDDFEQQAVAAHLTGRNDQCRESLAEGYREALRRGDITRAARFAFWIGHGLMFEGGMSEATGWFARARQLIAASPDCVERGYLLIPEAVMEIDDKSEEAHRAFAEGREIGLRFDDLNLIAMAGHGMGRALIRLGRAREGMTVLDSVMVAVTSGEVSPMVVGDVYCGVLEACHEVLDLRRAREWTGALTRWCEAHPTIVPYRGPCMVYRAEVMQFHGSWKDAFEEAQRACEWLSGPVVPEGAADAFYRIGELHRLQGKYAEAEEAYRQASRLGRQPEPGLPLLWLARGQRDAARNALRRALGEVSREFAKRAGLLDADVEVCLALGDVPGARAGAEELAQIAERLEAPYLRAVAGRAHGAVLLAEGDAAGCLGPLRRAWSDWQQMEAPYESARVRVLIGLAYQALGDKDSAAMEFDAARWVFEQLGAMPDLARLDSVASEPTAPAAPGGLTAREAEVLRLVATGCTNKQIAAALVISEHTVARHIQNMLAKLDCPSRAALAAFAVEHDLGPSSHG